MYYSEAISRIDNKLRAGKESAHAMALNGTITGGSPGRRLGGVSSSRMVVFEYVP